jgi:hypothetical protein
LRTVLFSQNKKQQQKSKIDDYSFDAVKLTPTQPPKVVRNMLQPKCNTDADRIGNDRRDVSECSKEWNESPTQYSRAIP